MGMSVPGNSCRTCSSATTTAGCQFRLPGECVYYSGSNISGPGINTGDNFNTIVNKLSSFVASESNELEFTPGDTGFPIIGATTYVSSSLTNRKVLVIRNGLVQRGTDPGDGSTYITKAFSSNTITFSHALIADEYIQILII